MNNSGVIDKESDKTIAQLEKYERKLAYEIIKRIVDVCVSVSLGALLLVPMVLLAILIRVDSDGPAIFSQKRIGRNGEIFTIYKFRTMSKSAPQGGTSTAVESNHITKIGYILRKTSIDELPQLWNVIKGDMSIIGYRPLSVSDIKANELRKQYGVFRIRPGITGWAQVNGRNSISDEEKVRLDVQYMQERSLKMDVLCLMRTIVTVISGEGNQ